MDYGRRERKDLHLPGILRTEPRSGQVSKSRFKITLLRVIQGKRLLRRERYNSRLMLNLNGQMSSRELCEQKINEMT